MPIILFSIIMISGDDFMIDLSIPANTLGLFNFKQYVKKDGKNTFKYIFFDNYDFIVNLHDKGKLRDVSFDNVQKTILCSSIHLGYDLFVCPNCGKETIVAHTCSSRYCTKCGAKSSQRRAAYVSSMAFKSKHRHIVFTIPAQLRIYFIKNRSLLDGLFVVARNTLASLFNDRKYRKQKRLEKKKDIFYHRKNNKSQYLYKDTTDNVVFGAIASLHTFGRPLDWNPHIHVLVCEDAYDSKNDKIKNFGYMDYKKLRQTWRYQLLNYLDKHIGNDKEFQRLKRWFYRRYEEGFYVYAPKIKDEQTKDDIEKCVQYITRYTSRPIMAESRIVNYNDDKKTIHWFYHRHEDNKRIDVTESVYSFLNKVLMHCPEKNFKMVRYFGFYSNKSIKTYNRMAELLSHKQKRIEELKNARRAVIEKRQKELHFRYNMIKSFQRDPLLCECGEIMEYKESYDPFGGDDKNDREYRDRKILKAKYSYEQRKKVNK